MSNSIRTADHQPTNTASPMNTDALRDMLGMIRALEARVAALEGKIGEPVGTPFDGAMRIRPAGDMIAHVLCARNLPDAYGR